VGESGRKIVALKEEPNKNEFLSFIHVKANQVKILTDIAKGKEISTQNIVGHA
jgi:hypothetical protein